VDECKPLPHGGGGLHAQPHRGCARLLWEPGWAVQVDPIKPTLKPPATKHVKLICDILLSTFACKFNLRRYNRVTNPIKLTLAAEFSSLRVAASVGRCRSTLSNPC